ncbi:MAG: cytidine deaminase [Tindallia sp. MSAO_Bac2]|nr:MAG: cytidine deaminase [Tindallia sp. MSAO_Bac2]
MRPDWDSYFMEMASVAKKRSTCLRRQVGAVLVKNHQILTSGYNGAPAGLSHCDETGCLRDELQVPSGERHEICRGLHAEQNAIIQAAQHGISVGGSTMYITHHPCVICAKMMINAGISTVIFSGDYPDELSKKMLEDAGIKMKHWDPADSRE